MLAFALDRLDEDKKDASMPVFNAQKHPMVAYKQLGKTITIISDPEVVQDIYTKQNKFIDKGPFLLDLLRPLYGESLVGLPANEIWR